MKEQYIRQVKKGLILPRSAKAEVVRDLQEIFASAAEHGESEQQVAERLGTPRSRSMPPQPRTACRPARSDRRTP